VLLAMVVVAVREQRPGAPQRMAMVVMVVSHRVEPSGLARQLSQLMAELFSTRIGRMAATVEL
jgi:hypothetical protein